MPEVNKESKGSSRQEITKELIKISPHFAWVMLVIGAILYFQGPITSLLENKRFKKITVSIFSIELSDAKDLNDQPVDVSELKALDARAAHVKDYIDGARILWVDDLHPKQNIDQRKALEKLGVIVDLTTNTIEALEYLKVNIYDAVVTDLKRENDTSAECQSQNFSAAGCDLLRKMSKALGRKMPRTFIYSTNIDPEHGTPPFASGMTSRIDELIHYLLDSFERREVNFADVK